MAIYYVAKTGNDGNPGSLAQPKLTIAAGIGLLSGGDTLYIRTGVYVESILDSLPSGTSWSDFTLVSNYNGEAVTLQPSSGDRVLHFQQVNGASQHYIEINGLVIDGTSGAELECVKITGPNNPTLSTTSHHIRLRGCELKNAQGSGVLESQLTHHNEYIACHIHDNGKALGPTIGFCHGLYLGGNDGLVDNCDIHTNVGYGVHIYDNGNPAEANNYVVRSCRVYDEGFAANEAGILFSGNNNIAYGNIVRDCYFGFVIRRNDNKVYNNTIVQNVGGISIEGSNLTYRNNIFYQNTTDVIVDGGTGTIEDHNLMTDPFFLSPGSDDFHLTLGSPAIDFGVIVDGVAYTGSSPDAGALEFGGEDLPTPVVVVTPNPLPPGGGGTIDYGSDGDTVDIPGVGTGLPPTGSVPLPPGQTLVVVIAYNINGSISIQSTVRQFAGGLTYRAAAGYAPRSIKGGADLSVDNSELVGIMANKAIANQLGFLIKGVLTDEDIEIGRFDNARDELFLVNYEDLSMGKYFLPSSGGIGQIKSKRGTFEAETRGKQYFLQQTFGDLISKLCRARVGDDVGDGTGAHDYKKQRFGCKVRIDPPFWRSETAYTVRPPNDAAIGSVVKPNIYNGRHFECTIAGTSAIYPAPQTEPAWNLAVGATTTDGSVTWRAILALEVFGSVTGAINRRFFQDSGRYEPPTTGIGINTQIALFAIVAASVSGNYFEIEGGDLTRVFLPGTTFAVTESIANDATYTVTVSSLVSGRTRIAVAETIPDDRAGGTVAAPNALASGFFTNGLLTFLTGLNVGITQEIKEFTLAQYPVVAVNQGAFKFMLDGDVSANFIVGQRLAVAGSTGNDTEYNVVAVFYNIGTDQTEITVGSVIADATVDGNILAGPGQFELFERMPFDIELGDEYVASAGCDLSKAMCKFKFRNIYNRRAEDETPGTDVALLTPDRPQ
jgi:serralysin